uniref:hypothetical protein n=1 Tax=Serratia marcescens TaxID=615 RepID=UPI001BCEB0EA|nr:hypothetical protein [Serratia marcescens]
MSASEKKQQKARSADPKQGPTVTAPDITAVAPSAGEQPGQPNPASQPAETAPDVNTYVEALLIQAVSPKGFYRAGLFWPHSGVRVFVSDKSVADDTDTLAERGGTPFMSVSTAKRLKAEPHLRVTVLDDTGTEDQEA